MRPWSRHLAGERPDLMASGPILAKGLGKLLYSAAHGRVFEHVLGRAAGPLPERRRFGLSIPRSARLCDGRRLSRRACLAPSPRGCDTFAPPRGVKGLNRPLLMEKWQLNRTFRPSKHYPCVTLTAAFVGAAQDISIA
jgi:hypothetical protein